MKRSIAIITLIVLGCGGRQGTVLKTWTRLDDYSVSISADQGAVEMTVTPSIKIQTIDEVFFNHLHLNLRYPDASERIDVGIISIFSSEEPEVELSPVTVDVDYLLLDEIVTSDAFDENSTLDWKKEGRYHIGPGESRRIRIPRAAGRRMVVVRSRIYGPEDGTLLTSYYHGFELE